MALRAGNVSRKQPENIIFQKLQKSPGKNEYGHVQKDKGRFSVPVITDSVN